MYYLLFDILTDMVLYWLHNFQVQICTYRLDYLHSNDFHHTFQQNRYNHLCCFLILLISDQGPRHNIYNQLYWLPIDQHLHWHLFSDHLDIYICRQLYTKHNLVLLLYLPEPDYHNYNICYLPICYLFCHHQQHFRHRYINIHQYSHFQPSTNHPDTNNHLHMERTVVSLLINSDKIPERISG